jgi:hypothetical protein
VYNFTAIPERKKERKKGYVSGKGIHREIRKCDESEKNI